ncbi:pre-mrna-splicing factor rse1 [Ceraceosorus bombacis]|uniref:Pre-mRNA-splicing factor RSE1 n=1 Tax=Ceraceosorus bombacis TaxID=401625 RepID=A0A0P1BP17_9BASI|nr:pre-mrna-splicing factor rse1 [Ceraceosorus bombacis]
MHLYNLSLVPPSNITAAVVGQFSGTRTQEIVVCRGGSRLELLRPDTSSGRSVSLAEQECFGIVRSLASFRLTGGSKDYLIVGSDSGRIALLELDIKTLQFVQVHCETFGRSGSRRIVPGQYLAVDPKGRAVMIGALEKAKLVYILNRDAAANLTISSPLEAHRNSAIIHALIGVDVGYENPVFAALEIGYEEADRDASGAAYESTEKLFTYYELDLGLNHVVRRWTSPVSHTASHLIAVPGGYNQTSERWEGPSGVLVCSEDYISYKHSVGEEHRIPIPKRLNPVNAEQRGSIIVASVCHRMKTGFFFLVQNEDGDLFKITIEHDGEDMQALKIKYFDTVPVAASLVILRAGLLFVASESGPSYIYSFQKLGDDDDLPEYSSVDYDSLGAGDEAPEVPTFIPRPLENLMQTDEISALDPILDAKVLNPLMTDSPQIIAACGRGPRSSFKMLQYGLEVQEAISSDLPGVPGAVWTTKLKAEDQYDAYIILSFVNGTLVLSIGETIEEVSDSGFLTSAPTLAVQQLGTDALLQVHPGGIRHVMIDKQVTEWETPAAPNGRPTQIVAAATNQRQVVLALAPTNELVYFELDMDGQLNEYQERKSVGARVLTLSIADVPEGRQRTPYLAVGCDDQTVRVVSLDPDSTLASISIQALTAPASSICIAEMEDSVIDRNHATLFVNIGLSNGVLLRTVLDPISGQLTDTRTRFLGAKPVRLVRVKLHGTQTAVLALSSRSWLSYTHQGRSHFTPLIFEALDHAWSFSAEMCPQGLIGIISGSLRIFTIPTLGTKLKTDTLPLSYTPRRFVNHPSRTTLFYVVEADHRTLSPWAQEQRLAASGSSSRKVKRGVIDLPAAEFGPVRGEAGQWSSCIRVVDVEGFKTTFQLDLEGNEAAFSAALVPFGAAEPYLVVGSGVDVHVSPRSVGQAYLSVYKLIDDGRGLELLQKTEVDDIPLALKSFGGRLLAGVGKALRIYDLGKKKLLRKCENKNFSTSIVSLETQGSRIIVSDQAESVFYATYKPAENRLLIFADDTVPRWMTVTQLLDYDTVAGADKFGNVFISRIDADISKSVDEDASGLTVLHEKPYLQGAPHKSQLVAHYHLNEIITSLTKVSLVPGGREVILYTGLGGTIGALIPFVAKEDVDTLSTLEMHLRQEATSSVVGRDHLAYRGYYAPVKGVVDGDLCETYGLLSPPKQRAIAEELDRTPAEVNKKLESMRTTSAF